MWIPFAATEAARFASSMGLSLAGLFCYAGVVVVERRARSQDLHARRQLDIGTLLDSLPEAVLLFDKSSRVVDANALAEQLTGFSVNELRGMDDRTLSRQLDEHDDQSEPLVTRALRGELIRQNRRCYRRHSDGREIEALVSASPVKNDATGETVGAMILIRDVTELGQLQRRLADTQRHNAIGQMAAGIAHDFNNVLDTISQSVFLLELNAEESPQNRKMYTDLIKGAVRRGAEINERVREYLRTGTGEQTDVDLRQLLDDVVELTRPMWQLTRKVRVRTHFGPVPKVRANAADIRRVFTNLIINALEAMPGGGMLTIGCEAVEEKVVVTVEDTGQGIAPEHQKKIFGPYFTTKKAGTGLGLSGAQRIVTATGGSISYKTQPGKGTCFIVEMPASRRREGTARQHRPNDRGQEAESDPATENANESVFRAA